MYFRNFFKSRLTQIVSLDCLELDSYKVFYVLAQNPNFLALAHAIGEMPILSGLSLETRRRIAKASRLIQCDRRKIVLSQGQPHESLFLVVSGQLDYCGMTSDGDEITLATFGAGTASSWLSVFHRTPTQRDLVGNPGSILLSIPHRLIKQVLADNPALYPEVIEYEANRFRALLDWQQLSLTKDRTSRIALMLIQLAAIKGDTSPQPIVYLTGERLAKTTQCSRQTLLTSLGKLQDAGLIDQCYGKVILLDLEGLRAYSAAPS